MISLIQLEYIVAVDTYRHFVTAAENSFVTQPTLSMQIKKVEEAGHHTQGIENQSSTKKR
jgi:LysR family hydrogen peroxide-inducible transcriptional activator